MDSKNKETDLKDKETVQEKELLPDGNYKYPDGTIRNSLGQLQVGSARLCTTGSKRNRNKKLESYLDMTIGKDGKRAVDRLLDIAFYDYDSKGDGKIPRHSTSNQLEAIKILMGYAFGRPKVQIDKQVDIDLSVEHRIAHVTKLLQQNKKVISNVEVIDIDVGDVREIEDDRD